MLSDERLEEIRKVSDEINGVFSDGDDCWERQAFADLLAEIDRLRAASVPPAGSVKVRVAVAMADEGEDWAAFGTAGFEDRQSMEEAMRWIDGGERAAYGDLYVMPPKPAEVTGEVEGV